MHDKPVILLFIKAPLRGSVKSRLATAIGTDAALELYQCFVLDAVDAMGALTIPLRICCYPQDAVSTIRAWLGSERAYMPQQGNGLGERMENAFEQIFQEGYERATLIGSDIPELSTALMYEAMAALDSHDAVIGPAADGGYYLIGFTAKTFVPSVFHDIAWSTNTVCRETLSRLKQMGKRVHLLPELRDIDTQADLHVFFKQHRSENSKPTRALAYLAEHGERLFQA